jgi:sugar phosphate isomerase/epimerase
MKIKRHFAAGLAAASLLLNAQADFHDHVGLQLYSLRATTLAHGLPASLDLAKSYGLTEVETGGSAPGFNADQIRAALDARGLKAVSAHFQYDALAKDLPGAIREAKALGVKFAICPWIPHDGAFNAATARKATDDFNKWGEAFRAEGIRFGYHPHGYEFVAGATAGDTLLDEMIRGTKPENVCFEMDVFWAVHGGGDPVKLLGKYPSRWVALHVKDIRKGAPTGLTTGHAPDTDNVTVGTGQIDWKAVIGMAQKIGVQYYFIEDETPTPLECIPASLAYLRGLKL